MLKAGLDAAVQRKRYQLQCLHYPAAQSGVPHPSAPRRLRWLVVAVPAAGGASTTEHCPK